LVIGCWSPNIKVIGVGGGGGNAVNRMIASDVGWNFGQSTHARFGSSICPQTVTNWTEADAVQEQAAILLSVRKQLNRDEIATTLEC